MSRHIATPLPYGRWAYLKSLHPSRGHYLHISAPIIRNPLAVKAELAHEPFQGPRWVIGRTSTYNMGRNKAKRERRAHKWGAV